MPMCWSAICLLSSCILSAECKGPGNGFSWVSLWNWVCFLYFLNILLLILFCPSQEVAYFSATIPEILLTKHSLLLQGNVFQNQEHISAKWWFKLGLGGFHWDFYLIQIWLEQHSLVNSRMFLSLEILFPELYMLHSEILSAHNCNAM